MIRLLLEIGQHRVISFSRVFPASNVDIIGQTCVEFAVESCSVCRSLFNPECNFCTGIMFPPPSSPPHTQVVPSYEAISQPSPLPNQCDYTTFQSLWNSLTVDRCFDSTVVIFEEQKGVASAWRVDDNLRFCRELLVCSPGWSARLPLEQLTSYSTHVRDLSQERFRTDSLSVSFHRILQLNFIGSR